MSRSPSWIEPEDFSRLGLAEPDPKPVEKATGGERRDVSSGPDPRPPTPLQLESSVEAVVAMQERTDLFRRWLVSLVGERPFFAADAEGLVLLSQHVSSEKAVTAQVLERALRLLRPFFGPSRVRSSSLTLEDGQAVQMVWQNTDRGRVAVGVFGEPELDAEQLSWVGRALERVFARES